MRLVTELAEVGVSEPARAQDHHRAAGRLTAMLVAAGIDPVDVYAIWNKIGGGIAGSYLDLVKTRALLVTPAGAAPAAVPGETRGRTCPASSKHKNRGFAKSSKPEATFQALLHEIG